MGLEQPPVGLAVKLVGLEAIQSALEELQPHFVSRKDWSLELGNLPVAKRSPAAVASLSNFPQLFKLIARVMYLFGNSRKIAPRVCVTCRRYRPGSRGLRMHIDSRFYYEDVVYGCILEN